MRFRILLAATAATLLAAGAASAEDTPGVTATSIKIGNTSPYSGPASAYGVIGKTHSAYWAKVNREGGVNGRMIDFISLDDGYSPPKTVEQARKLVEQENVAFLFQTLGTPTNSAIHRYMNAKKVPQMFVATGASKWGHPKEYPWTMGFQPTYDVKAKSTRNMRSITSRTRRSRFCSRTTITAKTIATASCAALATRRTSSSRCCPMRRRTRRSTARSSP